MKLLSAFFLATTLAVSATAWPYLEPSLTRNGTAVIYSAVRDGQVGGQPFTIKIPASLTDKQYTMLNFAYEVAKADGHKYPQLVQGIIMQESKAGAMSDFRVAGLTNQPNDRYFGIGQVKLAAAKAVMERYPELWSHLDTKTDEELKARLIVDDRFNIRITSKYALMMGMNTNPTNAVTAYNRGLGGAKEVDPASHPYTSKVKHHAENIQQLRMRLQSPPQPKLALNERLVKAGGADQDHGRPR